MFSIALSTQKCVVQLYSIVFLQLIDNIERIYNYSGGGGVHIGNKTQTQYREFIELLLRLECTRSFCSNSSSSSYRSRKEEEGKCLPKHGNIFFPFKVI